MTDAVLQNMINEEARVAMTELVNLPMYSDLTSMILLSKKNINEISSVNKRMKAGTGSGSILYDNMVSSPMKACPGQIEFIYDYKNNVIPEETIKQGFGFNAGEDIKYDTPIGATFGYAQTANFGRGFGWNLQDEIINNLLSKGLNGAKFDFIKKSLERWKNNIAQQFGYQTLYGRGIITPYNTDRTMYNSAVTATYGYPKYDEMEGLFTYLFDNTHSLYGISQTTAPKWRVNYVQFTTATTGNFMGYTSANVDSRADLLETTGTITKTVGKATILDIIDRVMKKAYPAGVGNENVVICVSPNMHSVIQDAIDQMKYSGSRMTNEALQKFITYNDGIDLTSIIEYHGYPIKAMLDGYDTDGSALSTTGINAKDFVNRWWPDDYIAILNLNDFDYYYNETVPFKFEEGIDIPGKWFSRLSTFSGSGQVVCYNRSRQTVIKFPSNIAI